MRVGAIATLVAIAMVAQPGTARADGAFPDSQSVMLPADRPREIVVATTFGLVSTEDDGVTWTFACENGLTVMSGGGMYAMGPSPENRIYATSDVGVVVSGDGGCSWMRGAGDLVSLPPPRAVTPFDVFPDPADPRRAFVVTAEQDSTDLLYHAFRSDDGGLTFSGPIYTSPAGALITGIESSASSARTVYVTFYEVTPVDPAMPSMPMRVHPRLAESLDGGGTWTVKDIEPGLGNAIPLLIAIDPADPRVIYLRLISPAGVLDQYQGIAISRDGGETWTRPLNVARGSLVGFARVSDTTLLAVGATAPPQLGEPPVPALFRSDDSGQSFVTEALPFHPLGLSHRGRTTFVATKDTVDGFALASSADAGRTWTPRLRFADIRAIKACVWSSCQTECSKFGELLFPSEVCARASKPPTNGAGCGCALGSGVAGSRAGEADGGGGGRTLFVGLVALILVGTAGRLLRRRGRGG